MSLSRPRGTIFPDPYCATPVRDREHLTGRIAPDAHRAFFRKFCAPGLANALVTNFFSRLVAATSHLPPHYDPDSEPELLLIMSRLNFDGPELPLGSGRTDSPPAVPPTQQAGEGHDG